MRGLPPGVLRDSQFLLGLDGNVRLSEQDEGGKGVESRGSYLCILVTRPGAQTTLPTA